MSQLIKKSIQYKFVLQMIYLNDRGIFSKRTIKVLRYTDNKVIAYCYKRRAVRTFNKSNILALTPVVLEQKKVI